MVRKRAKKTKQSRAEKTFASGSPVIQGLDPKAPRKYKSLTLQMNEYEYTRLKQASESQDRGLADYIRIALKKAISEDIGD